MTSTQQWDPTVVQQIVHELKDKKGALLPILHGIQDSQGYIPKQAVPIIAHALNQTSAEIHGVISFYHHFRTEPVGKHLLQVCRAEACQARGSRQLEKHIKEALKIDYHTTTDDQQITLEPVYCLGNCASGPSVRMNDDIIADVSPEKFDALVEKLNTYVVELN